MSDHRSAFLQAMKWTFETVVYFIVLALMLLFRVALVLAAIVLPIGLPMLIWKIMQG